MNRYVCVKLWWCLALPFILTTCSQRQPAFEAPLLKNIGNYSVKVTTSSDFAQRFFNQGIIMANGFNHAEAERSFREAVRQDSTFAMGYWGIAYVLGPNYNSSGDNLAVVKDIRDAVAKAVKYSRQAASWEQAVIRAIGIKFPAGSVSTDAEGYASSMKEVYLQFPENDFAATLYAEAVMNLHPWDFYVRKGGEPRPWTPEIISLLEKVISINPGNPLANHLYLHAAEAGPGVEKALPSAERLKTLVPSAGHLVHMPSHIYINTGDYHEGSVANEKAVEADSIYIAECKAQGVYPQLYYPHNYHFLSATAAFEGRGARAIEAAYKAVSILDPKYFHEAGYETVQHYTTIPLHVLVKFEQWEKILASPSPSQDLVYPRAVWHYARGMAFANTNKMTSARAELDSLTAIGSSDAVKKIIIWGLNPATEICRISSLVLQAEIHAKEGNLKAATGLLKEAIVMEDHLNYNEPPDWFFSVRHLLGSVLLQARQYKEAEEIYREDLQVWPKNGFALSGLYEALKGQGNQSDAEKVKQQFTASWKLADSALKDSRMDNTRRSNLSLRVDGDSPVALIAMTGTMCMK